MSKTYVPTDAEVGAAVKTLLQAFACYSSGGGAPAAEKPAKTKDEPKADPTPPATPPSGSAGSDEPAGSADAISTEDFTKACLAFVKETKKEPELKALLTQHGSPDTRITTVPPENRQAVLDGLAELRLQ